MKKADIDWNTGAFAVIGKGNKERVVYLSPIAIFHLKACLSLYEYEENDNAYVFSTSRRPHHQLTTSAIRTEKQPINAKYNISKKLTPYILRHNMVTTSLNSGTQLADLQSLLGHVNQSTTLRYVKVSEERKQSAHKKYVH